MDTKSKNSLLYSITFILAVLLLGYSVLTTASITIFYDHIKYDSYFKSDNFTSKLSFLSNSLTRYYTEFKDYEQKTADQKISQEEVKNNLQYNENFVNEGINRIKNRYEFEINDTPKAVNTQNEAVKLRDAEIENFRKENAKTEEQIRVELIRSKDDEYASIKGNINREPGIKYYLTRKDTGEVLTNMKITSNVDEYISKNSMFWDKYPKQITRSDEKMSDEINRTLLEANLQGYFMVPESGDDYSSIYYENVNFISTRTRLVNEGIAGVVSFAAAIILFIIISRRKDRDNTILNNVAGFYIRIPMELRFVIFFLVSLGYGNILFQSGGYILNMPLPAYILFSVTCSTYMLYVLLHIRGAYNIIAKAENFKLQWRGTITYLVISTLYKGLLYRRTTLKVGLLLVASMIFGMSFVGVGTAHDGGLVFFALMYMLVYTLFVPIYVVKKVVSFNQLVRGSEQVVYGDFDYIIEEKGSGLIRTLAHNFNNIKNGFKRSIDNQIRSERLKTELITNVSHDLKTPLTSIINYVDLLKDKELSEEEREGYISILDRKAQRLKALIEDLFEASKMTSGAVELNREKVDIVAMLKQTLGEFDEKINNSSLTFRVNLPGEKVFLYLDGKKTWRVFENLINNALKYSQPNTRVYIDLVENEQSVKVVMKNIAGYEMDFNVEEIFERFKRGDKSRNTEGSGLGLAIAKSIVELQNGFMNIEIDGDLFKVTVEFKKQYKTTQGI